VPQQGRETVADLRERLGLFSFQDDSAASVPTATLKSEWDQIGVRPGGIVEWLTAVPGAGAVTLAWHAMSHSTFGRGLWAIVDSAHESYAPGFAGWGVALSQALLIRPSNRREESWAIEQCLRCPAVSATWAWIDHKTPERTCRRWQLAAEAGEGVGVFFRPDSAQREPVWADLRLLATPCAGGQGMARQVQIDVLYRRGGVGGPPRRWELNHVSGALRLVPELADSATSRRENRASAI